MKAFFEKLEQHLLGRSTKIENAIFPYKTAQLEANVKANRTRSTKSTYQKEWSFASNYLIFWKFCFSTRKLIWCTNCPNIHIETFNTCFVSGCFFLVSIIKYKNRIRNCVYNHNLLIFFYFYWFYADVKGTTFLFLLFLLLQQDVFRKVVKMMKVFDCVIFLWLGFSGSIFMSSRFL